MAILKVARMGHPVLRETSQPVTEEEIASPDFQAFVDDLMETMEEHDGTGLAAPQVHVPRRVLVYKVEGQGPRVPLRVLINPVVTPQGEDTDEDWEGCLSLPDLRGLVRRHRAVHVEAVDRQGRPLKFEAKDFHARVIQHETDHLEGVLYVDRMDDMSSLTYLEEFARYAAS